MKKVSMMTWQFDAFLPRGLCVSKTTTIDTEKKKLFGGNASYLVFLYGFMGSTQTKTITITKWIPIHLQLHTLCSLSLFCSALYSDEHDPQFVLPSLQQTHSIFVDVFC